MYTKDEIKNKLINELSHHPQNPLINEELMGVTVEKLIDNAVEIVDLSERDLIFITPSRKIDSILQNDDNPPKIVRYNSLEAARIVESVFSGIAGGGNPVVLGYAALSIINALREIRKSIPERESVLFWVIYNSDGHRVTYEEAKLLYQNASRTYVRIIADEFDEALQELLQIGCIKKSEGIIKVVDRIIIR